MKQLPRGIRNNNPLNLVHVPANKWQGLASPPSDGRMCVFVTAVKGMRAAWVNMIAYKDRRGIRTIRGALEVWAPWSENDVDAYVRSVCRRSGFAESDDLDFERYEHARPLIEAMIWHENGMQPYSDAEIDMALAQAGVVPETPRSLQASRTVKGAQVAAAGGTVAAVSGVLAEAAPALPVLREIADFARAHPTALLIALGALAIIGAGVAVHAKWDERRRGIA